MFFIKDILAFWFWIWYKDGMKEKTTLQKYAYYEDVLKKIGGFPLSEKLTIEKLDLSRGVIQAAYKEMYGLKFKGTIIDYLCWVSTEYLIENAPETMKTPEKQIAYIVLNYENNKEIFNNLLRLFKENYKYLFDLIGTEDRKLFVKLMEFWYDHNNQ